MTTPTLVGRPAHPRATASILPADLPGISLAELVDTAEMLTRVDRKYVLHRDEAPALLADLDPRTRVLDIDGTRAQRYRSCGFDTPDLAAYRSAAHPRRRRFKVRTRTYVDSDLCYLEVKTRGPRGTTVKTRTPHPGGPAAAHRLNAAGRDWLARTLSDRLQEHLSHAQHTADTLACVLDSGYVRTTLLLPDGQGRATIDENLWWRHGDEQLAAPHLVIIETKSSSTPSSLDRLLWRAGHRPERMSKYATALAALDPELPANRWARTLTRHF